MQRKLSRGYFIIAGVFIISLSIINLCIAAPTSYYFGEAYNADAQLLYTENYSISDLETLVIYKSKHGEILAAKSIHYQHGKPYRPDITIYKHSDNTTLTLTDSHNVLRLTQIDHQHNQAVIRRNPIRNQLITDEAFNRYIKDHWQTIQHSGKATVDFTLAQHARIVRVDLRKSKHTHCNNLGYQCLSLRPSNWFLRLLVKEVILGYDQQLQLRYFNGPANSIANASKQRISIHYQLGAAQQVQLNNGYEVKLQLSQGMP